MRFSHIRALVVPLALLPGLCAFSQAARYDNNVYTINSSYPLPGGLYPVLSYPGATIAVCNAPATGFTVLDPTTNTISNGCTNYATTYTNAAESGTCSSPTQLTRTSSTTCVGTADAEGGWGVWMGAGTYQFTVTTVQGSYGPYDFSVGGGGGGGVTSLNSLTGALSITGDSTITVTPSGSSIALHATGSAGSGTLNFIPLWTPNGTTLGNSHLDDEVTTANTITSSETVQSIVSGQDAIPFLAVNNGTSTLHVAAPQFICPNITTSTVSGCAFGIGISTANVDADRLSIEYRYGGSVAADRGALSMSTAVTDNQEALMWDWAGNVYLPQLVSEPSLATDSSGKIIPGTGGAFSGGLGASYQDVTEIAAPADPASGNDRLYTNSSTHQLACLTSSGGNCMPSGGLNQLTGDGSAGPGSGSQVFTLTTVNASPGSCGDSTHVCQITTNGKGLTTSQTAVAISAGGGTVLCAPNAQTGTAYTLVLADGTASGSACIGTVTMNNAAANNVTVPPNSSVSLPTPDEIDLIQLGAGQTCFVAGAGVTLTTPTSLCARAQDSTIGIRQISANTWIVFGDTQ